MHRHAVDQAQAQQQSGRQQQLDSLSSISRAADAAEPRGGLRGSTSQTAIHGRAAADMEEAELTARRGFAGAAGTGDLLDPDADATHVGSAVCSCADH